jgi:hypothetical protein
LFRLVGLEVVAEYGDFDRTPLESESPEMVFVLCAAGDRVDRARAD